MTGIGLAAAVPPYGPPSIAWGALVPVLCVLAGRDAARAGRACGVAGATFVLATRGWIAPVVAAGTHGGQVGGAVALAWVTLSEAALWGGMGSIAARLPGPLVWRAPLAWAAREWVSSQWPWAFPWFALGASQFTEPAVMQVAAWGGVIGLAALIVLVNAMIATAWTTRRRAWVVGAIVLVALVHALGSARLAGIALAPRGGELRIGLVSNGLTTREKWLAAMAEPVLQQYLALTTEAVRQGANVVVWPETALAVALEDEPGVRARIAGKLAPGGAVLIAGTSGARHGEPAGPTNSVVMIDAHGDVVGRYDKQRLVPVGEFVPLRALFGWLPVVARAEPDLLAGTMPGLFAVGGARVGAVVCYEAVLPDLVRAVAAAGADVIVNPSDDGWFLGTAALLHHFGLAVPRAVEVGRPLVRVANGGISAIVDPTGAIRFTMPPAAAVRVETVWWPRESTPFVRGGWVLGPLSALLVAGLLIGGLLNQRPRAR